MIHVHSAGLANALFNHPDIRPTLEKGDHRLYAEDIVRDPRNVLFANEHGAVMFLGRSSGVYDLHGGFLRAYRGKVALADTSVALDRLFKGHNAKRVNVRVPYVLRPARIFVRKLGFTSLGLDPVKPIEHFTMEAEKWAA